MLYLVIKTLVLPPASPILASAIGLVLLAQGKRGWGWGLTVAGFLALYIVTTPIFSVTIARSLESPSTALTWPPAPNTEQAIVILSAGANSFAPEYGTDIVGPLGLERLRYGARLHKVTGLPILVTGGMPPKVNRPLARLQEEALADFGVDVRWIEERSVNTRENGLYSSPILKNDGVESVYLVTTAAHMPRSIAAFQHAGLTVTPAPTAFTEPLSLTPVDFMPSASGLRRSYWALHEWLGRLYYWLAYGI